MIEKYNADAGSEGSDLIRAATAQVLHALVDQYARGGPEAAHALRRIGLVARATQRTHSALEGAEDDDLPVEANSAGTPPGPTAMAAVETFGARAITEGIALARDYLARQRAAEGRPPLSSLLDEMRHARSAGDEAAELAIAKRLRNLYGIELPPVSTPQPVAAGLDVQEPAREADFFVIPPTDPFAILPTEPGGSAKC